MRMKDKVVILTGASSGIGRSAALRLAEEGASLVAVARRMEKLEELKEEASKLEGEVYPIAGDLSKEEDIKRVVEETIEKYGRIDVLINNAGVLDQFLTANDMENDIWDKVMEVNVTGVMKMTREVIGHMLEKKSGNIINMASVGGLYGGRGGMAYVASKHAVVGMTKHIGFEFQPHGIRCNAIAPGSIDTGISPGGSEINQDVLNNIMKGVEILPVMGQAEEIANLVLFLASDESSFINGTTVVADGGWTAF